MKLNLFRPFLYFLVAVAGIIYGFLIAENEIFPHEIIEHMMEKRENADKQNEGVEEQGYKSVNVKELISVDKNNADSIRNLAIKIIFDRETLPEQMPDIVYRVDDNEYSYISNLDSIEQFEVTQPHNIKSVGYIFHPKKDNNKLFIYHQGHRGDFIKGKRTIEYFVDKGFTVYAFCMPLLGKNNKPTVWVDKIGSIYMEDHKFFKFLDNPISYFINPVITMINYAGCQNFKSITMCGISGGGWTTTLASAIDTRIENSFPVAGSYPMYLRFNYSKKSYGDFEQDYPELYKKVNYLDLYLLGATGKGRKQIQVLNEKDPCCFDGTFSDHYEPFVKEAVKEIGTGMYNVVRDKENPEHCISEFSLGKIFAEID